MTLEEIKLFLNKYQPENYRHQVPEKPLVSVLVQTYQHVKYIKDCLDGILRQETDFDFEILIGEDESTDGTREICIEYAKKYPDKIRLFLHDRNREFKEKKFYPGQFNVFYNLFSARGKYIAVCEGDDYWTDAFKLQKQVEILETYKDCTVVCGGYISMGPYINETHIKNLKVSGEEEKEKGFFFGLQDHMNSWIVKTLTIMGRNNPDIIAKFWQYDYFLDMHIYYYLLKQGKGYYMREVLGVNIQHTGGLYSLTTQEERFLIHYKLYKELFEKTKDEIVRKKFLGVIFGYLNYKNHTPITHKEMSTTQILLVSFKTIRTGRELKTLIKLLIPSKAKTTLKKLLKTGR